MQVPARPEDDSNPEDPAGDPQLHSPLKAVDVARAFWRSPVLRIAIFVVIALGIFKVVRMMIEPVDPKRADFWSAPIVALGALAIMARLEGRTLQSFGLNRRRRALGEMALGFVIGGITMSIVVGSMALYGWYHGRLEPVRAAMLHALGVNLGVFLAIGIYEEVVYRGYFFQTLERRWGADVAFAVTMVTFGLLHLAAPIPHTSVTLKLIGALSIAVEAGILFAAAYLLTRRLWMPIGIHWAWNFFEGPVYGTPVTGDDFGPSIFAGRIQGPAWATGGGFGPEASIPALLVGTALGLVLLWMAVLRKHARERNVEE